MGPEPGQKTVLITGCTPGGIGHSLCLEFHARGCHVIATARRTEVLKDMADMGMTTLPLDVTSAESIAACRASVEKLTGGKLDVLINNAGLTHTIPAADIDMDDVRNTFETNVFGVMAMVQSFVRLLTASRGLIINISSLASVTPYCFGSVYCATKGAVSAYSRTLRIELRPFGVRVMVVMAGTVRSNIASRVHRSLPEDSIYMPIKEHFEWRLTYSQNHATVRTEDFARDVVDAALRDEEGSWWGRLAGVPKWLWTGGHARGVWILSFFGEWLIDRVLANTFKVDYMTKKIQEANEDKKNV